MFPCCDATYEKYLKEENGRLVIDKDALSEINKSKGEENQIDPDTCCRCVCHVQGKAVLH